MKALGISLHKDYLRFAVLEGSKTNPTLVEKGRIKTTDPDEVPQLMDWFETQYSQLISVHAPGVVAYKLVLEPKLDQQHYLSFPMGILNLLARKNGILINEFSGKAITPNKLGHVKGTDLFNLVDKTFGMQPPHWDKYQKEAILVAWFCL